MRKRSVSQAFRRSQAAHRRLQAHHGRKKKEVTAGSNKYDIHFIREQYHAGVYATQKRKKRKLNGQEKKSVYGDVINTFY